MTPWRADLPHLALAPLKMGRESIMGWGHSLNKGSGVGTGSAPRGGVRGVPGYSTNG